MTAPEDVIRQALSAFQILHDAPEGDCKACAALAALDELVAHRDHAHEVGFSEGYNAATKADAEGADELQNVAAHWIGRTTEAEQQAEFWKNSYEGESSQHEATRDELVAWRVRAERLQEELRTKIKMGGEWRAG